MTRDLRRMTVSRRLLLKGLLAGGAGLYCHPVLGQEPTTSRQIAMQLLDDHFSIDIHAHPGRFHRDGRRVEERIAEMTTAGITASFFSVSTDRAVIRRDPEVGRPRAYREFEPGESYNDTYSRFAVLDPWFLNGHLIPILKPDDIERARKLQRPGALRAAEGADFLEGRLDRVAEAFERGIRCIQLVHYNINEVADIQTEDPKHNGLSDFGKHVIREMNRLGMIVDLAHTTEKVTRDVARITTKPIILSHSALRRKPRPYTRLIYADHAKAVTGTSGLIGVWPAGKGDLDRWIRRFQRLADLVGPQYLAMGTDMDGLRNTVFGDYRELTDFATALLDAGFSKEETAGILGENFVRVFREIAGTTKT